VEFLHEPLHPREQFDITCLAPDHGTLPHRLGGDEIMQPDLGREGGDAVLNDVSMRHEWVRRG
jgi:hypothetical protein